MLNDIYNKRIIELAGNIPRLGRLPAPDASATAHSKLCGSTVKVDLKMEGPVVSDFAHDVKACALGQASSSIMARHVVGSTASELRELRETVRRFASACAEVLTKRSCVGFAGSSAIGRPELSMCGRTSATASVVMRLVSRNSAADNSCRSSHGGTFSASDSRSPAPPMSKVYL